MAKGGDISMKRAYYNNHDIILERVVKSNKALQIRFDKEGKLWFRFVALNTRNPRWLKGKLIQENKPLNVYTEPALKVYGVTYFISDFERSAGHGRYNNNIDGTS